MPIEETDYECPRCMCRYVLTLSVERGDPEPLVARDFTCPKCGRRVSEMQPAGLTGVLMAYRRSG